jgi:hypothetical protein
MARLSGRPSTRAASHLTAFSAVAKTTLGWNMWSR